MDLKIVVSYEAPKMGGLQANTNAAVGVFSVAFVVVVV